MPRHGRPVGEIRAAMLLRLSERPTWRSDELAQALQVPLPVARYTLSRLVAAGQVLVVGVELHPLGGRPAHVYARAGEDEQPQRPAWLR
jgi:predicted ArsR family transcriptional regulator